MYKCQYCNNDRKCIILNEECIMDDPNEAKCIDMYHVPPNSVIEYDEKEYEESELDDIIDESGDFQSDEDELDDIIDNY